MTTPNESRTFPQPPTGEAPVWEPPQSQTDALSPSEDSARGDASTDETATRVTAAGSTAPGRLPPAARRANSTTALLALSAVIAAAGIGFAVGHVTGSGGSATGQTNVTGISRGPNGLPAIGAIASGVPAFGDRLRDGGLAPGNGTLTGTVVSVTSNSITIRLATGQTETIATGSSTTYHAQTSASSGDVTAGATVIVQTSGTGLPDAGSAASSAAPVAGARTATSVTITGK
jgi:hypothetical protein